MQNYLKLAAVAADAAAAAAATPCACCMTSPLRMSLTSFASRSRTAHTSCCACPTGKPAAGAATLMRCAARSSPHREYTCIGKKAVCIKEGVAAPAAVLCNKHHIRKARQG
eukprot:scaffold79264_cov34-Tisochrysis_lutea.AAC.1